MSKLILLRHGQSVWNKKDVFTGWIDIPLSEQGIQEAILAGKILSSEVIDVIFVSSLVRAEMTAFIVMAYNKNPKVPCKEHKSGEDHFSWYEEGKEHTDSFIPVYEAWELNERMYGKLQGESKPKIRELFGAEQVQIWRRSYDVNPPEGESLEDTARRTIPFFQEKIIEEVKKGKNVFVCAHGNSLRSILMVLEKLSKEEVLKLEVATGVPIIYEYKDGDFERLGS